MGDCACVVNLNFICWTVRRTLVNGSNGQLVTAHYNKFLFMRMTRSMGHQAFSCLVFVFAFIPYSTGENKFI